MLRNLGSTPRSTSRFTPGVVAFGGEGGGEVNVALPGSDPKLAGSSTLAAPLSMAVCRQSSGLPTGIELDLASFSPTTHGVTPLSALQPVLSRSSITGWSLSLIHISEPTRLGMISYAV